MRTQVIGAVRLGEVIHAPEPLMWDDVHVHHGRQCRSTEHTMDVYKAHRLCTYSTPQADGIVLLDASILIVALDSAYNISLRYLQGTTTPDSSIVEQVLGVAGPLLPVGIAGVDERRKLMSTSVW